MIQVYVTYKRHFRLKDTNWLQVKAWGNTFHTEGNQKKKKVGMTTLVSDKPDFKQKQFKLHITKENYTLTKG